MQIIVNTKGWNNMRESFDVNKMTEREKAVRARAFKWVDAHMWLTNEAQKLVYLEDCSIEEIIELIEDNVYGTVRYPADLIGDLKRIA